MIRRICNAITKLSIRYRAVTVVLVVVSLVLGGVAITQLNREFIPPVDYPQVFIVTQNPGMTADEMLNVYTLRLEDAIEGIRGVLNVESTTGPGFLFMQISHEFGINKGALVRRIEDAIDGIGLPNGLEMTADLTPGLVEDILSRSPTMVEHFRPVHLFSMPGEVLASIPESFLEGNLDECGMEHIRAIIAGEEEPMPPHDLPVAWKITRPQLISFSMADMPLATLSISGGGGRDIILPIVESEIIPSLLTVDEIADVKALGGEELPTDEVVSQAEPESTPPPQEWDPGDETPAPLPDEWVIALSGAAGWLGQNQPEAVSDLTPEILSAALTFSMPPITPSPDALLESLENEDALAALPPETIAWLPPDFVANLDADVRDALDERVRAYTQWDGAGDAAARAEEHGNFPPYFKLLSQASSMLGMDVESPEELSPQALTLTVTAIRSMASAVEEALPFPAMALRLDLGSLAVIKFFGGIPDAAWLRMPPETLGWLPDQIIGLFSDRLRSALEERASEVGGLGALAQTAWDTGDLPPYFEAIGEMFGHHGLDTPEELTPDVLTGLEAFIPRITLTLSSATLRRLPPETLGWIPEYIADALGDELRTELDERAAAIGGVGALARTAWENGDLPPFLDAMAFQMGGQRICGPETLTPGLLQVVGDISPGALSRSLSPEALRRLPPETLAALPPNTIESLDEGLRMELEELAEPAGGLGTTYNSSKSSSAPPMPESWSRARIPIRNADELLNNPFGMTAAQFLNAMVAHLDPDTASVLIESLTPDVIAYLSEREDNFLGKLDPAVLASLSQEVVESLPDEYREQAESAFIPSDTVTRYNGNPGLILTVYKNSEANTVRATHALLDALDVIRAEHPDLEITVISELGSYIEESIAGVAREGGLGAIFAVVVIFLFLNRSWRSTLVTAVSIPLSVLLALALMRWLPPSVHNLLTPLDHPESGLIGSVLDFLMRLFPSDLTLNIMTLSGLTVAVGRVVDDSIVVLENIYRHIQRREPARKAVLDGTGDVSVAILASTVTTVIVFLPIGLTGGLVGEFFLPFGLTVTYALAASFLVAITVVPLLAYRFIRREHLPEERETRLQKIYTPIINWALGHRWQILVIASILFAISMWIMSTRPRSLMPPIGEPEITVDVSLPQGTSIIETDALVQDLEDYLESLRSEGLLEGYQTIVGGRRGLEFLLGGGVQQNVAQIVASVSDEGDITELTRQVRERAEEIMGKDRVVVSAISLAESSVSGLSLVLSGDPEVLTSNDRLVIETLRSVEGLTNITSSLTLGAQSGTSELIIRVDGRPAIKYTAEVEGKDAMGIMARAKQALIDLGLEGVTVTEGFRSEAQLKGFAEITNSLWGAIVVVYLVMMLTFGSPVHPFTILFSLPLAVVGAALGLALTDRILGLSAMVGMLMLVGIVVTNAIVLIDRVQANRRDRGMSAKEALIEAGRTRLRPILMTALAAIFALLPLAAGTTRGAIIAAELGTVVIGGLTTSTFLTLVVVPVVYSLLDDLLAGRIGKFRSR